MGSTRVLLVDDDPRVLSSLRRALEGSSVPIEVVATCGSAADAARFIDGATPFDVALVDLKLADGSGLDVIAAIRRKRPDAAPVALTIFDDRTLVLDALRAGARGYLLKDTPRERFAEHVRDAAVGGAPITPSVARWVLDALQPRSDADPTAETRTLTSREQEVLELLCQGHRYADVATALGIGLGTVQGYVKQIYDKLEVGSKAELTALAFRRGLVK